MDKIKALSLKYKVPIIEDAACALGSSIDGVKCGKMGRLATFSFHPRKILTTGEGGAVVTDDLDIAEKIRKLRNHGQDFSNGVDFIMPGFNYRMTEFQAALAVSQLNRYDTILQERLKAADYYNRNLCDLEFIRPYPTDAERGFNCQTYVAFVSDGHRDNVIDHLKEQGIEAGIGTYSIPHTTFYSNKYDIDKSHHTESLSAFKNLISLPLYGGITEDEQDFVIEALKKYKADKIRSQIKQTVKLS
jgi:dTDP-4-amino-4,6-dideoxygalactose transaminase